MPRGRPPKSSLWSSVRSIIPSGPSESRSSTPDARLPRALALNRASQPPCAHASRRRAESPRAEPQAASLVGLRDRGSARASDHSAGDDAVEQCEDGRPARTDPGAPAAASAVAPTIACSSVRIRGSFDAPMTSPTPATTRSARAARTPRRARCGRAVGAAGLKRLHAQKLSLPAPGVTLRNTAVVFALATSGVRGDPPRSCRWYSASS